MKKLLIVLLLGFALHKMTEEVYDHYWMIGFDLCKDQYIIDVNKGVDAPLTKRFKCTKEKMGAFRYLEYVLVRPHWSGPGDERWYY